MFTKVGFFHFGRGHAEPFEALRGEFERAKRCKRPLAGSLIVLPEGFNIRKRYNDTNTRCQFYPDDPVRLRDVAKEFGVAFVAGLILEHEHNGTRRYNSAYFVDGSNHIVICHKACSDGFEARSMKRNDTEHNYTACEVALCDVRNPYHSAGGVVVGALICADANPPKTLRDHSYWNRVPAVVKASDIICVPAYMGKDIIKIESDGNGECRAALTPDCKVLVLANSRPDGIKSFITDTAGIIRESFSGPENKVVALPFTPPRHLSGQIP